jgi:hypothetical protein
MTDDERISNLKSLGYSEREAEFLCLAALHSGYFVRRQFLCFVERTRGKLDERLTDKALKAGHAKALTFRYKRIVYSFCSKPFYDALGETDNRNRRMHEIFTIKNRLISLDFVLKHRSCRFLETEAEKVAFFRDELKIGVEYLPTKRYRSQESSSTTDRYFIDKFPIRISTHVEGQFTVDFCYVDGGAHSTAGFETFIGQYRSLWARVPAFRLVYIATSSGQFPRALRAFERLVGRGSDIPLDPEIERLLNYFRNRELYERRELQTFDQPKLIQFREDRRAFSEAKHEALYEAWKRGGDDAVMNDLCPESRPNSAMKCEFLPYFSPFRYELFGTLTSGSGRAA